MFNLCLSEIVNPLVVFCRRNSNSSVLVFLEWFFFIFCFQLRWEDSTFPLDFLSLLRGSGVYFLPDVRYCVGGFPMLARLLTQVNDTGIFFYLFIRSKRKVVQNAPLVNKLTKGASPTPFLAEGIATVTI